MKVSMLFSNKFHVDPCIAHVCSSTGADLVLFPYALVAMCTGHVYYYPRQAGFSMCRSVTRDERYWDLLKIRNTTWDTQVRQVVVTDPPQYAGLTMVKHVNRNIDWTPAYRRELQMMHLFVPQVAQCPNTVNTPRISLRELSEQAASGGFRPLPPDPYAEYPATNPRNIPRYRKPAQCTARINPINRRG